MFSLIQEFNEIQNSHYLGANIVATVTDIVKHYNAMNILSMEESTHTLLKNARKGIALKSQFSNYISEVKRVIKEAQEARYSKQAANDTNQAVVGLYKINVADENNFKVAKFNNSSAESDGDFVVNTSDISLSSGKKNNGVRLPSIKKDVLRVLKKSPSVTHY